MILFDVVDFAVLHHVSGWNPYKVKALSGVLTEVERLLWTGQHREAVRYLRARHCPGATVFINYLLYYQSRLIDYGAWQG